jgi:hypothetical protein
VTVAPKGAIKNIEIPPSFVTKPISIKMNQGD